MRSEAAGVVVVGILRVPSVPEEAGVDSEAMVERLWAKQTALFCATGQPESPC